MDLYFPDPKQIEYLNLVIDDKITKCLLEDNQTLRDRITQLETGIRNYLTGDYPHPRKYRPGKCLHETDYWEECHYCNTEHFQQLLMVDHD